MLAIGGALGIVRASGALHKGLLATILKLPMSFFDTTPRGRILNRFSKDVDCIDDHMRIMLLIFYFQLSLMTATIVAVAYTTPLFLVIAVLLTLVFITFQVSDLC